MWYQNIIQIFKIRDLRKKIFFVLGAFAVFRLMANIPIPGADTEKLKMFFEQFQIFGLLSTFTGGAFDKLSIVMLGLGPYITSSVILQLLSMAFPQLERIYKEEGEAGRQKFEQYGRILAVPLSMLQGYAMLALLRRQGVIEVVSPLSLFSSVLTITAGTLFLMWLGELISEKGLGNGISLLIFAGIVADFPTNILQIFSDIKADQAGILAYLVFFVMSLCIIAGVVLVNEARRDIPISYAKRVRGRKIYGGASTYLPMRVNPAGVMPIIFSLSILTFPGMIANFLKGAGGWVGTFAQRAALFFENPWIYGILYFSLVFVFTFFYTLVTFDTKTIATNLQKSGGFIPGIRPGYSTANFFNYTLNRVLPFGALFLGIIAVLPSIVPSIIGWLTGTEIISFQVLIGGTSLLILVSVVLESMREFKAQLQMRKYDTL